MFILFPLSTANISVITDYQCLIAYVVLVLCGFDVRYTCIIVVIRYSSIIQDLLTVYVAEIYNQLAVFVGGVQDKTSDRISGLLIG